MLDAFEKKAETSLEVFHKHRQNPDLSDQDLKNLRSLGYVQ